MTKGRAKNRAKKTHTASRGLRDRSTLKEIGVSTWDRAGLKRILKSFKGKKILVIGDVGVDRYTEGLVERISPEAPVPIVLVEEEKLKLGLAANVADNVRTLGGVPLLAGAIGRDRSAEDFKKLLRSSKIKADYLVVDPSRRTVLKERIVSDRQQLLRVDYESLHPVSAKTQRALLARVKTLIKACDGIIVEDYAKGLMSLDFLKSVFKLAEREGKRVAVDPNIKTPMEMYSGASILTPNTREAESLGGMKIVDQESLLEVGRKILVATRAKHVVITRGKEGMAVFTAEKREVHEIPTYAREVFDVSGAGDTVISVLTLALAAGASIEDAANLGNLAAGVEVAKRGTATVSPAEILSAMESWN